MKSKDHVIISAILNKITTTIDGGWRITFDLDSSQSEQILSLSKLRDKNLSIGIVPEPE